jgi:glycosyltransferase involved in cell wall biosynthesis
MESNTLPKISVIMPVYNGEQFIEQAIDSLLAQTFQDWELVVVDDGSTDSTPQILKRYVDPRIVVIRQENGGEACARNTGLDHMRGEYMAFLDADDIYFPNALEDLSSFLDSNPNYGVVFSDGYIFDQNDNQMMRLTEVRPGIFTGDILNPLVITPSVITVPVCTMSRISNVRKYGLYFDEKNNLIGTDWDFWIRLAVHVQFGYLDRLTCKYRIHTTNLTRVTGSEKRRKDQAYRQMKIMNSNWFGRLSMNTREMFFFDLLTNALTGDVEMQTQVLKSEQFAGISTIKRADLWRLVGIDILKNSRNSSLARTCFSQSLNLNDGDRKTRSLLWSLRLGSSPALMFIKLWHFILHFREKVTSSRNSPSERLQKMLGVR